MVVRCECDAKKCENAKFFCYSSAMRCEFWFHFCITFAFRTFSNFSHFRTFFCIFCAFFSLFSQLFGEISTKKVEKVRKCEKSAKSAMRMRNANANAMRKSCNAMRWAFTKSANANAMRKRFRTTIPVARHLGSAAAESPRVTVVRISNE